MVFGIDVGDEVVGVLGLVGVVVVVDVFVVVFD